MTDSTISTTRTPINTWADVVALVNANNGVAVVTMETLRDIDGYGRLGTTVRQNILNKLHSIGVGIIRPELPSEGNAPVIIFRQGTPVAEIVDLIKMSNSGMMGRNHEHAAMLLRRLNMMPDPQMVHERVAQAQEALQVVVDSTAYSGL